MCTLVQNRSVSRAYDFVEAILKVYTFLGNNSLFTFNTALSKAHQYQAQINVYTCTESFSVEGL